MSTYRIADLTVNMDVHGRTAMQAEIYRIQDSETADIRIFLEPEKIALEGDSVDEIEYMFSGKNFYVQLLCFDGMMLHASSVVMDGKAYLFSAPSGTGKSTHTQLWQRVFGADRARILNDDKPAIRCIDGVWYAYGTPWTGKSTTSLNLRMPIAGICFLRQGQKNSIRRLPATQAVFQILDQTFRPKFANLYGMLLDTVEKLVSQVDVYEMECNMEPEAAMLSHYVMSGEDKQLQNGV